MNIDPADEVRAFSLGKTFLAAALAGLCDEYERAERMRRAVAKFVELDFPESPGADADVLANELERVVAPWPDLNKRLLLVDLWFVQPFAPYDVKVPSSDLKKALSELASTLGIDDALAEVTATVKELTGASTGKQVAKVVGISGLGAVLIGSGAWIVAPLIGTAIGTASGLAGAAATAHGLAVLGGGAVAAGGAGVAGGMFAVTTTGAAAGVLLGGGGSALFQLGKRQAERELLKLKVKFKVSVLHTEGQLLVAQRYSTYLHEQIEATRRDLEQERLISERRSKRIERLEEALEMLEESQKWLDDEVESTSMS